MAINVQDDATYILEDGTKVKGNVLKNDVTNPNSTSELVIKPGSLENANGDAGDGNGVIQGKYGTLTLNSDGTYEYTLTKDMNYLGAGVDLHDEVFTYTVEWHDDNGDDKSKDVELKIDIHGVNDAPVITDVTRNVFEGDDGDVLLVNHQGDAHTGTLKLADIDPKTPGVQTDVDEGDTHTFQKVGKVVVSSSDVNKKLLTGVDVTVNDDGTYDVTGDFDALSEGETATVEFQYQVVDTNATSGSKTASETKTVTVTVVGQNDAVVINDDTIQTYDQLIDGDIYKSILKNDTDPDVNELPPKIVSTGFHDLQFYNEGGKISVDNDAKILEYTPGSGGAIAKEHFSFYYQATDGHTDPIGSAIAEFDMVNKDGSDIDFYQFGDNSDNSSIGGIAGKTNVISGMGGNDKLYGKEKGDILYGGSGDDYLEGGWGNDIYVAGKGNDGMVDTRGNDLYVFKKGDGYNTIDDQNLEIYTDAMGHETINRSYYNNKDVVEFDSSVKKKEIAIFQEEGQYQSMKIKYSTSADDKVSVAWQSEDHYGIEEIKASDGTKLDQAAMAAIIHEIATYDIDEDATNGLQTAQNVDDVQNNEHLMAFIANQWA